MLTGTEDSLCACPSGWVQWAEPLGQPHSVHACRERMKANNQTAVIVTLVLRRLRPSEHSWASPPFLPWAYTTSLGGCPSTRSLGSGGNRGAAVRPTQARQRRDRAAVTTQMPLSQSESEALNQGGPRGGSFAPLPASGAPGILGWRPHPSASAPSSQGPSPVCL